MCKLEVLRRALDRGKELNIYPASIRTFAHIATKFHFPWDGGKGSEDDEVTSISLSLLYYVACSVTGSGSHLYRQARFHDNSTRMDASNRAQGGNA